MKSSLVLFTFCSVLFVGACSTTRKACERANGHMAKAVQMCPDLLTAKERVDTVTVYLPGSAGAGEGSYTQAEMDSVAHLCSTLLAAAQRKVGEAYAANRKESAVEPLVQRMRANLCDLQPVELNDSALILRIWTERGQLRYYYHVLPQVAKAPVKSVVAQVVTKECPPEGVASWYRTAFWWLVALLACGVAIVVLMVWRALRTVPVITLILTATLATAQTDTTQHARWTNQAAMHRDGRGWHDLPPPMNIVNAGYLLEDAAVCRRDATYLSLAGLLVGGVMYTQNPAVGATIAGGALVYSLRLNLRGLKSQRMAARLMQLGYRAENLYDVVPDSIDAHPHLRIVPKR